MALNLMDLFKHIKWAKNGDITDMSQTDYEIGWSHLGDDTPTVEDFNLVQKLNDEKDQWLFGQIYEVLKANGIEPTEQNAQALLTSLQKMLLNVSNRAIPEAITELTKNTTTELGHTHEIAKANTMTAGIVKLTNDTKLDSEALALTAKAGKLLAQQIAQNKLDADNKFIQNSEKSSAVDSNSAGTVATSAAVKSANDNANGRVSKSGDTMSGDLVVPYLKATTEYISVTARDSNFAGLNIIRQGNFGNWLARMEAMPDKRWKFWTEDSLEIFLPARGGTVALEHEVVPRNGDTTINGRHFFRNDLSRIGIESTSAEFLGIDFTNCNGKHPQCSLQAVDVGDYANELRFFTTPQGDNYDTDRRQHIATINPDGYIWTKAYGWLSDAFGKQAKYAFYPHHYNGAAVWKIPIGNGPNCLMITTMDVGLVSNPQGFLLPERYIGWAIPNAVDVGSERYSTGISMQDNNSKVTVWGTRPMGVHIQVIGDGQY